MMRTLGLILFVSCALACSRDPATGTAEAQSGPPRELVVFAATSLRDALAEVAPPFERAAGAQVVFAFGSSGDLSRQIVAADRADVFLSADEREMDRVAEAGRIDASTRRDLLGNRLVVVEPVDGASGAFDGGFATSQLADARIARWSLANVETVPAGRYARAWLESIGRWPGVEPRVVPGVDVRAALAAVESGGCAAGIVYATDAARSQRVRIVHVVPEAEGPRIRYPGAVVTRGAAPDLAARFLAHVEAAESRAVFERHGFVVIASAQ
jgi:molybdate transport system substrate-binding protein